MLGAMESAQDASLCGLQAKTAIAELAESVLCRICRVIGGGVRPELVAEVKYLTWTDDSLSRQVVYEGLREEAGGRRGSPAGAALTTLTRLAERSNWSHYRRGLPRACDNC